jgi:hypothetical protein
MRRWIGLAVVAVLAAGCEEPDLSVPTEAEVAQYFEATRIHSTSVAGNVAEITVAQSPDQLRRGGRIWAQVGPYIYLFSSPTLSLFQDFGGLAGVRVVTIVGNTEVARALLPRTALNELTWRRALNVAGRARLEGTDRVSLLEDLTRFGEDLTEFEYNPRYTRRR